MLVMSYKKTLSLSRSQKSFHSGTMGLEVSLQCQVSGLIPGPVQWVKGSRIAAAAALVATVAWTKKKKKKKKKERKKEREKKPLIKVTEIHPYVFF